MDKNTTWGSSDVTFSGQKKPVQIATEQTNKTEPKTDGKEVLHKPSQLNHEILFDTPFLKVRKNKNFFYSERKGIDSIAFILLATNVADERKIGLIHEYKDPLEKFLDTAFGGSIDDEKYHSDLRVLVKDEAMEEAGFDVSFNDISYYGKVICSTQNNQYVHLFAVKVDKTKQQTRTTTNATELLSSVSWLTLPDMKKIEDWKAITIISKRMMNNEVIAYTGK